LTCTIRMRELTGCANTGAKTVHVYGLILTELRQLQDKNSPSPKCQEKRIYRLSSGK
jgi:hypothetical protein